MGSYDGLKWMLHFASVCDWLRKWDSTTKWFFLTLTITIRINLVLLFGKREMSYSSLWNQFPYKYVNVKLYAMQSKTPLTVRCLTITEMLHLKKWTTVIIRHHKLYDMSGFWRCWNMKKASLRIYAVWHTGAWTHVCKRTHMFLFIA